MATDAAGTEDQGFNVDLWWGADGAVMAVSGELDLATAPLLWDAVAPLVPRAPAELVVDLRRTTFMDAAGLGTLVRAAQALAPAGCRVVLRSPAPVVRRLLEVAGVGPVLAVVDGDGG